MKTSVLIICISGKSHTLQTHTHTHLYQTLNDVCYSRPSRDGDDDDAKKIFISFTHHFARINGSTEPQSMKNNRSIEKGRERMIIFYNAISIYIKKFNRTGECPWIVVNRPKRMLSWKEKQLLNCISQWDPTTDIQERSRVIVIGIATESEREKRLIG